MDIKRAKQEIKDTIEAYLVKNELGEYRIPRIRQRPILLIGPPGIGKTQIMEQISRECKIGLVSYTMGDIISSVYEKMEKTGNKEGILFIDEVNSVSDDLASEMLQFLEGKTFGNRWVPEGWVVVIAGNPPEYSRSSRQFDIASLDKIKKIEVEQNFEVWKEYAYKHEVHPAIISYLELRRKNFYRIENTIDGKSFATARGWEDLSRFIQVYEVLGKTVDFEVVVQYIQNKTIARDFANYLELFYKYRNNYSIENLIKGVWDASVVQKIKSSSLDAQLSIIGILNGKLSELFVLCYKEDMFIKKLYDFMMDYRTHQNTYTISDVWRIVETELEQKKKQDLISRDEELTLRKIAVFFEKATVEAAKNQLEHSMAYEIAKDMFDKAVDDLRERVETTTSTLKNVYDFIKEAFGESQEMAAFITGINENFYGDWFIKENGLNAVYGQDKEAMLKEQRREILEQMDEMEESLELQIDF